MRVVDAMVEWFRADGRVGAALERNAVGMEKSVNIGKVLFTAWLSAYVRAFVWLVPVPPPTASSARSA